MASAPRPVILICINFTLIFHNVYFSSVAPIAGCFFSLTPVVTGKTRRARVLRKQDPCSGRFFRVDAIVLALHSSILKLR